MVFLSKIKNIKKYTLKLTSLAICKKPLTICFANGKRSPQHKSPRVNKAFSFTFDGNLALPTILNSLSATVYFVTMSSMSMASFLLMLNGLSVCKRDSCFGEKLGRGKPLQRARRDTAEHDVLTSKAWESARKLAERKVSSSLSSFNYQYKENLRSDRSRACVCMPNEGRYSTN